MFQLEVAVDGHHQVWLPAGEQAGAAAIIARRRNPPLRNIADDRFRVIRVPSGEIVLYVRFLEREIAGWSEGAL